LLKSDLRGIETINHTGEQDIISKMLKSDLRGIETIILRLGILQVSMLKSDLRGIETGYDARNKPFKTS